MTKLDEIAQYADHAFEASQRAYNAGDGDKFRACAQVHQGLADLYTHLRNGGRIQ